MPISLTTILAILQKIPKLDLSKHSQEVQFAISLLPERAKIKGHMVALRATLQKAVADGDIDAEDFLSFYMSWANGERILPLPVEPVPVTPPLPPTPAKPPATPAAEIRPTSLVLEVHSLSHQGEPIPFRVDDLGEYFQVVRTDGVDSITGGSALYVGVGYIDSEGKPINFEERGCLYLYNTARYEAVSENGRGTDVLWCDTPGMPPGEGEVQRTENGVVNYYLAEARRTGLMDITVKVPEPPSTAVRPQFIRLRCFTPGAGGQRAFSKDLRFPPIR